MNKIYTSLLAFLFVSSAAFGQLEGTTWKIAPQASALLVQPVDMSMVWWENTEADITTRACYFDDEYVFGADGTFTNVLGAETWIEPWQVAGTEACGAPVAPHDGSNAATWTYDATTGITINGLGAYIGLAKVHNSGELASPNDAVSTITYPVTFSNNNETMTIAINFGGGIWNFILNKVETSSVEELVDDLFSFYPNPATNEIQINTTNDIDELSISDMTGKQMMVQRNLSQNETIDVSGFAHGMYIIQCRSGNKLSTEKLIIQK